MPVITHRLIPSAKRSTAGFRFKGSLITVVTPGNDNGETFRVLEVLGPRCEQVVLLGYPPFLKDVVDSGMNRAIPWARYRLKMVFAGEMPSEEWRSLVSERAGGNGRALL